MKKIILHLCADTGSDMEFRSLCSQKFAKVFFEVNR